MIRHTPVTLDTLNSVETFAFSILMVAFFSALSVTVTIYNGKMKMIKYTTMCIVVMHLGEISTIILNGKTREDFLIL